MTRIHTYDAKIVKGRYWNIVFEIDEPNIIDLTGFVFKAQFRKCEDCPILLDTDITIDLPLTVKIELTKDKTNMFEIGEAISEVSFVKDAGDPVTLFFIKAKILKPINDYGN